MTDFYPYVTVLAPVASSVLVALLSNWDKINPSKKKIQDIYEDSKATKEMVNNLEKEMQPLKEATRTSLQTMILEKCRKIQISIDSGEKDYSEQLKQLIILYKEYWLCKFNHQGQLYFDNTIKRASEDDNILVRELMNTYFPEYAPAKEE